MNTGVENNTEILLKIMTTWFLYVKSNFDIPTTV